MHHCKGLLAGLSARVLLRRGSTPPAHLDGSLPGDFGWDPLGLGADPDRLKWFAEVRAALQAQGLLCLFNTTWSSQMVLLKQRCAPAVRFSMQ